MLRLYIDEAIRRKRITLLIRLGRLFYSYKIPYSTLTR